MFPWVPLQPANQQGVGTGSAALSFVADWKLQQLQDRVGIERDWEPAVG